MAKNKLTVDFYLHDTIRGKKMNACIKKFNTNGYVIWHSLLESLCASPNHFMDVNDEDYFEELADYCLVDIETLTEFLNWITSKDWNMFSKDLWIKYKIVMSPKLTEQLIDSMYSRRKDGSKPPNEMNLIQMKIVKLNLTEEEVNLT